MQPTATTVLIEAQDSRHQRVARHIHDAALATGVPFDYLLAQANSESRLDPNATSTRSSAMGLYQFTAGTWLEMVKKHGAEHGLGDYADAITKGTDGRWTVNDAQVKKEILEMRKDSRISALMAGEYAADNGKVLESKLGRKASPHDLYLAHFLGAGGAIKVLREVGAGDDTATAAGILPEAAKANPEVFHHQDDGQAKSVDALYQSVRNRFRRSMANAAEVAKDLTKPSMDLAELRPQARPGTEELSQSSDTVTLASVEAAMDATPVPDLSQYAPFPVALTQSAAEESNAYPVRLPPAVNATRADQVTWRGLIDALGGKS